MFDIAIIGAGPAGMTAAVYAARKKLKTIILTEKIGGQMVYSGEIDNYLGFNLISGMDLSLKFFEHISKFDLELKTEETVNKINKIDGGFLLSTNKNDYKAKTVIITSGKISKKLNIPGEEEYKNKGVTYCATCDGPIFSGKNVAIIGGGNSALDACLQMMKISPKVYLINDLANLTGDQIMIEKIINNPAVEILNSSKLLEIKGDTFVKEIIVDTNGQKRNIPVMGILIEIGLVPNSDLGLDIKKNERAEIIIDEKNETNIPGLFAAGDVTNVAHKQIIIAAGEGAKATLSAAKYLNRFKEKRSEHMQKYKCTVCGYIYDPAENNNVEFADLPEDWTCPTCGVGKDQFEAI